MLLISCSSTRAHDNRHLLVSPIHCFSACLPGLDAVISKIDKISHKIEKSTTCTNLLGKFRYNKTLYDK
jgi:hypothetical protein